jgi:enoyl-CoA hydratase/carnithine racemase
VTVRLSKLSAVTISAIRGIARGAGSELALAMDIRFASREKAILGQIEVGFTAVAGGGPGGRLPALVGRGRAFEILLGGEDFNGGLAEQYGFVNRAIADSEFVAFVDAYATRVSRWDHGLQERSPLEYHLGEEVANIALTGAPSRAEATVS